MKKAGRVLAMSGGALAVILAIGAVAQTPSGGPRTQPSHVNNADYDPQPYFVDGVEYRPYVPAAQPQAPAQPSSTPQQPAQAQPVQAPSVPAAQSPASASSSGELRPYVATAASASSQVASSSSSSSSRSSASAEKKPAPVGQRPRYGSAVIEVLDKVTAESIRFEAPIGKPLRYKSLVYTVRACETSADDEAMQDVFAYIQIRTAPDQAQGSSLFKPREVFRGWSFASSPSLNPIQHPNYDAWVVGCRNPLPA